MGFINIDTDLLPSLINKEIVFYELWDISSGDFRRGSAHVHGTYVAQQGKSKIYSEPIWGDSLDSTYFDEEGLLVFENGSYVYLGPPPFNIYRLNYEDENGIKHQKLIPAESDIDLDIVAREIARGNEYFTTRVNLDGTDYYEFIEPKY